MLNKGAESLSDTELLAIVLRTGGENNSVLELAGKILKKFGGLKGLLNADITQIQTLKDVGTTKAVTLKAVCEIALRISMEEKSGDLSIRKPEEVFRFLKKDFFEKNKEYLYLLSLDSRNKIISKDLISIGTLNETLIHPREIFKTALLKNAAGIILAHNHPSGDTSPSMEDLKVTEQVAKAGNIIGVNFIDHVIVSNTGFLSIKSLGIPGSNKLSKQKGGD